MLGYLPESAPLYREMRVEEYLAYRAGLFGLRGAERRRRVGESAERCSLGAVRRRRIGTLSKGFRQRVGLAAVLVHDPKVLILDEPTSGLDPAQIAEMRGLIRELSGERTMLIVSHILPEVERSCDRVIVFAGGRVLADGAPGVGVSGGLIGSMLSGGRIVVECRGEGGAWRATGVEGIEVAARERLEDGWERLELRWTGAGTAREARERVARACAGDGVLVRELRSESGTLEELYMKLITGGVGAGAAAEVGVGAGENS
jgi:ABC-2 type transport system ATP-binding protein